MSVSRAHLPGSWSILSVVNTSPYLSDSLKMCIGSYLECASVLILNNQLHSGDLGSGQLSGVRHFCEWCLTP